VNEYHDQLCVFFFFCSERFVAVVIWFLPSRRVWNEHSPAGHSGVFRNEGPEHRSGTREKGLWRSGVRFMCHDGFVWRLV